MPRKGRMEYLKDAQTEMSLFFEKLPKKFFSFDEIFEILINNRQEWKLANATAGVDFISFLKKVNVIKEELNISLPNEKSTTRYITGSYYDYEIGATLYKKAYFSHYTAMALHNLTNNIPKITFLNLEQRQKNIEYNSELSQRGIDQAFSRQMRKTNQIATYKDQKVYMLNSKYSNNLGIEEIELNNKKYLVTGIERTLIDIAVRPDYAGGVSEIIDAYKLAKERCSVNILISLLKKLDYIYPYQQAIGFYLERAGYSSSLLEKLNEMKSEYNFYLCYKIEQKEFSERWKLFYPKGI